MTISYNWLCTYLPVKPDPERLSAILTSIGLEVEKMEPFEEVKGGLQGLLIGQVLQVAQHPNADKLKLTQVSTGAEPLQIVCGAPNVATGQKVVIAPVGATIYPTTGDPLTMKVAKIRGVESFGMICAEDEIGMGTSHAGILVLPDSAPVGQTASEYFNPFSDIVYEIGLTPNRMDAMSHWGVARDVCAYLSHHDGAEIKPVIPADYFRVDDHSLTIDVTIEDQIACKRYAGVCLAGVTVGPSPKWLQERLKSIGLRSINNIVDITNYIQHETGQPLHAFDYDAIGDKKIIVKTLPEGTPFIALDDKERKLSKEDLMICDASSPLCIAGVFGGAKSGVQIQTKNIFLESAWFHPVSIRKTSFRHGLRTDAATRFEKGVDISATVTVLQRAALLIKQVAGGAIASDIVDVYPSPEAKKEVRLTNAYLKKLSGKIYPPQSVKNILESLQFTVVEENAEALVVAVPFHKLDVSIPADIVEEILRIDGLDHIAIPTSITITPSVEDDYKPEAFKEKISSVLTGAGFTEILTNSITNAAYFSAAETNTSVKLLNNLSSELNMMRPSMLPTALEVIAHNAARKNTSLRLFEFGKTYTTTAPGLYNEVNHLCLYATGQLTAGSWKDTSVPVDVYYIKGMATTVVETLHIKGSSWQVEETGEGSTLVGLYIGKAKAGVAGLVSRELTQKFELKSPVFYIDFYWDQLMQLAGGSVQIKELSKFPVMERDLAMIVPRSMPYQQVAESIQKLKLPQLQDIKLFDVFESEKLGADKKSLALNFTFLDEEKTLTDKEVDGWMNKIMATLDKTLGAEIRK